MKRSGCFLTLVIMLMIVFPFVVGFSFLLPDSENLRPILNLQEQIMCGNTQTLERETHSYGGETQVELYCVDSVGNRSDMTWKLVFIIFGAIGAPWVLLMVIVWLMGGFSAVNENSDDNPDQKTMTHSTQKQVASDGTLTLTDQLKQLDEAYQKRLINREEYDTTRQRILNDWGR